MMVIEDSYIDLDKTANSGQCFRWVREGSRWSVIVEGHEATFRRIDDGRIEVASEFEDEEYWRTYLGLEHDYDAMFEKLVRDAPEDMRQAYGFSYGITILNQPFFETCVSFIISQNNNIPRIKRIISELCSNSSSSFPDAAGLDRLLAEHDFGLGYRHRYLVDFCKSAEAPDLVALSRMAPLAMGDTERLPLDDALKALESHAGIGPKVAACIALFSLGYMNCVPRDVWIKRAEEQYGIIWDDEHAGYQQQLIFFWQQSKHAS